MNRSLPQATPQFPSNVSAARKIIWTPQADARLTQLHISGISIRALARAFGLGRQAVSERAARLGITARLQLPQRKPAPMPNDDATRDPLPAGHPISWGLLVAGTSLEGAPYHPPSNVDQGALHSAP